MPYAKPLTKKAGPFAIINFERRAYPRYSIELACEYWPEDSKKSSPGQAANISEGGLLLHIREKIEIGQRLRLSLFIDTGVNYLPIEPLVQVVWKDLTLGEENYRMGVKILDVSPSEMAFL